MSGAMMKGRQCGHTATGRRAVRQGLVENVPHVEDAPGMTPECQEEAMGGRSGEGSGQARANAEAEFGLLEGQKEDWHGWSVLNKLVTGWDPPV